MQAERAGFREKRDEDAGSENRKREKGGGGGKRAREEGSEKRKEGSGRWVRRRWEARCGERVRRSGMDRGK